MDLKEYFRTIRETASSIETKFVIVVSKQTPDGGKAGGRTEVPRELAAKLIVDGMAELATKEQTEEFYQQQLQDKESADEQASRNRLQVAILSEADLRNWREPGKPDRK